MNNTSENIPNNNPEKKSIGRPKKWTDPDEMQALIDQYFIDCDNTIIKKQVVQKGQIIIVPTPTPYTMAGLGLTLNIARETLNNYQTSSHIGKGNEEDDKRFRDIILRAREKIHHQNITLALVGCHDSKIAALNLASNYGYSEKRELELTPGGLLAEYMALAVGEGRKILLEQQKQLEDTVVVENEEE